MRKVRFFLCARHIDCLLINKYDITVGLNMIQPEVVSKLVETAMTYLGRPYSGDFKCLDFLREVYRTVGLTLPPLAKNLTFDQLHDPPVGFVLYLLHKENTFDRNYSNAVLILPDRNCIHASYYFGNAVVITELDLLFEIYDIAAA